MREIYIAEDLCGDLATLCRQQNGYGPLNRDLEDQAFNSLDFPDFLVGRATKAESGFESSIQDKSLEYLMARQNTRKIVCTWRLNGWERRRPAEIAQPLCSLSVLQSCTHKSMWKGSSQVEGRWK
jgi:hypothetical protein